MGLFCFIIIFFVSVYLYRYYIFYFFVALNVGLSQRFLCAKLRVFPLYIPASCVYPDRSGWVHATGKEDSLSLAFRDKLMESKRTEAVLYLKKTTRIFSCGSKKAACLPALGQYA